MLFASAVTCAVLFAGYHTEATSARAVSDEMGVSDLSSAAGAANVPDAMRVLPPGKFRFTTGRDKEPQYIEGPVTCDTRDDTYRVTIGDPDARGVEIGLSPDESTLKYVDLGNRAGTYFAFYSDDSEGDPGAARGSVRKTDDTYLVSGEATGTTAHQQVTRLHFDIAVACP